MQLINASGDSAIESTGWRQPLAEMSRARSRFARRMHITTRLTYDNNRAFALLGFPIAQLMHDKISLSRLICLLTFVFSFVVTLHMGNRARL